MEGKKDKVKYVIVGIVDCRVIVGPLTNHTNK